MKYRKKPVVIEAWKVGSRSPYPDWLRNALYKGIVQAVLGRKSITYLIPTLEGEMTAECGDWIIQGVKGELYPCKDDIFRATYEAVKSESEKALYEIVEEAQELGFYDPG